MTEVPEDPIQEPIPELTREELQDLADELGTDLYRAQDLIAFIGEMCDGADADGSEVTTARVRSWLAYTGCGGAIVLPEAPQEQVAAALGAEALRSPATGAEQVRSDILTRIRQAWTACDDAGDRLAAVGMPGDRWRQIIDGERKPTSLDCAQIAEAFRVDVDWVPYGGSGKRPMLGSGSYPKAVGDATMAADMCPRCKGDNGEAWALCPACEEPR